MRYRKRIRICKGVYVNLSKSGISTTFGIPGLSINHSSKGTFLNTGIPSTGIYDRKRIGGAHSSTKKSSAQKKRTYNTQRKSELREFNISFDDDATIKISDENGVEITNRNLINKITRSKEYKDLLERVANQKVKESLDLINRITNIHKETPPLLNEDDFINHLNELEFLIKNPPSYEYRVFDNSAALKRCEASSNKVVNTHPIWTFKKRKREYVANKLANIKSQWEADEEKRKIEFEKTTFDSAIKARDSYLKIVNGEKSVIEKGLEDVFGNIRLPFDFDVDFEVENNFVYLSLDLPEIEDLPTTIIQLLASGKYKKKNLSKKDIRLNYLSTATSLALFFAGISFNISPKITNVIISSYTQKIDESLGTTYDSYVYSIDISREVYAKINLKYVNPIESFSNFKGEYHFTKTGLYREIDPSKISRK
jgi:hypothetical protein